MVAEKKGTIRFYDLLTQQAILSLDCGQSPLMSADWCLTNTIKVGAVAGNDWLIWDITRSRQAVGNRGGTLKLLLLRQSLDDNVCLFFFVCVFDSYPQEKRPAHIDKARFFKYEACFAFSLNKRDLICFDGVRHFCFFRWSRANENLFATTGCPGKISSQLLIHHLGHPQVCLLFYLPEHDYLLMSITLS